MRLAAAATGVVAVAAAILSLQPVTGPWWAGGDATSVYVGSSLTVFGGGRPSFTDHPGLPVQEALAATFTVQWALRGAPGTRERQADLWFHELEATRPYVRTWSIALFAGGALLAGLLLGRVYRSALAAFLGGVLFMAAPGLIPLDLFLSPDALLAALSLLSVYLMRRGLIARSPLAYAAAASVAGFALTVKVHAAALVVPLVVAVALRPPGPTALASARARIVSLARRRRGVLAGAVLAYLALVAAFNVGSAGPDGDEAVTAGALAAAVAAGGAIPAAALVVVQRRFAALPLLLAGAYLAGAVLPNLFFAGSLPTAIDGTWATATESGRVRVEPFEGALLPPRPWLPLVGVAAFGLVQALRAREWSESVWAIAAAATGVFAAARLGLLHYWATPIVLLIPLVLRGLVVRGRIALPALAAVALLVALPLARGLDASRDHGHRVAAQQQRNAWVLARLGPGEVALTNEGGTDREYFAMLRGYNPDGTARGFVPAAPDRELRILPADRGALIWVRRHGRTPRYLIPGQRDPCELVTGMGLRRAIVPTLRAGVYELRPGTCTPR